VDKQELRQMLQSYGRALAENHLPLTFFVGGDVEFGRVDTLNQTEAGKVLKSILEDEASQTFNVDKEYIDELLLTYYLMLNTSVLIEHTAHGVATGVYQPTVVRGVFTLDEDEIRDMYKLHRMEVPDKAWKDLNNVANSIPTSYNMSKIKAVKLDWQRCKTTNPRALMNYDDGIHIIPTDVLVGYLDKLKETARTAILKITYKRVNTATREQYVTLNKDAINMIYKEDLRFANDFYEQCHPSTFLYHGVHTNVEALNGFWKVGDLGISRFSFNGGRHISLSRIMDIKLATQKDLSAIKRYVNVDLDSVLDIFAHYVTMLDAEGKDKVMRDLGSNDPDLIKFVQMQMTIFTTTYQKFLHDYMVNNQEWFKGYTGIKQSQYENSYNLSSSEIKFGSTAEIDF
jgi:hypothetical protein